jgi:PAS domain-containing protein
VNASLAEQLRIDGVAGPFEKEYFRNDGSRVPVLVGAATLEGQENIAISVDLSERKRIEEALGQSETRYRRMIETMNEGVWMVDVDANTTFTNRRMAAMLGYEARNMLGRSIFEFMHEESREAGVQSLERPQGDTANR